MIINFAAASSSNKRKIKYKRRKCAGIGFRILSSHTNKYPPGFITRVISDKAFGNKVALIDSKIAKWRQTSITDSRTVDYYFMNSQMSSILEYEDYKGSDLIINIAYFPPQDASALSDIMGRIIIRSGGHK